MELKEDSMKRSLYLLISIGLLIFCLTGCNNKTSETNPNENIQNTICQNTYTADILGYNIEGKLDEDGKGTVTVDNQEYNFNYTLTDPTADSAKITIQDTGIPEIDGKSADLKLKGDDLVITYGGLSYTVKAVK